MKSDIGFIGKAAVVLAVIILASMMVVVTYTYIVNYTLEKAQPELDRLTKFGTDYYTCEIHYGGIDYKGRCDDKIWEGIGELVRFDKELELAKFCSSSPYSYRMKICQ